jgi:DNA-binding NarL/FixJ family response regulator
MKRTKKGRQKKYPKMFTMRATKSEHERLVSRAKEAQLSLSRFLVECGLSKDAATWEDRQQRERAIIQLIRTGNNLNQIAKQLNAQRGTIDYANLEQTIKTLKAMLQQIDTLCHHQ